MILIGQPHWSISVQLPMLLVVIILSLIIVLNRFKDLEDHESTTTQGDHTWPSCLVLVVVVIGGTGVVLKLVYSIIVVIRLVNTLRS